jgi:hemerythrin
MSTSWDESLAIGNAVIDDDHRSMMALINALEAAAAADDIDCDEVGRTLYALASLCHDHFDREEALQLSVGYPDYEAHRVGHDMLRRRLDSASAHYRQACSEVRSGMVRTLGDSLATWLVRHIVRTDVELKPFVSGSH